MNVQLHVSAEAVDQDCTNEYIGEEYIGEGAELHPEETSAVSRCLRSALRFGQLTTSAARIYAKQSGVDMEKWSVPSALANKTGWLTLVVASRTNDAYEDSTYAINEQLRGIDTDAAFLAALRSMR